MLYSSIRQNIFLARNVIPSYLELASEANFPPFFPPCFAIFCAQLVCRFGYNNDPLWCMGLVGVETSTAVVYIYVGDESGGHSSVSCITSVLMLLTMMQKASSYRGAYRVPLFN